MDKLEEQIKSLQSTVQALLERDKQAQLFNEMNIQKINELESQNQQLQDDLTKQKQTVDALTKVYDFEVQK